MQKIVPHLWYDREAAEAAEFYARVLPDSAVTSRSRLGGTPSGEVEMVSARLWGQDFMMISAGPYFSFTPAVSFFLSCDGEEEARRIWEGLEEGRRRELMPFGSYPFSPAFGWLEDRYGLSWQVAAASPATGPAAARVTPVLLFTGPVAGRAEEAMGRYVSLFPDSRVLSAERYGEGEGPERPGSLRRATFSLCGRPFACMDSALEHGFGFTEAVSFVVRCSDQEELDRYWAALSAVPEAEQCGWLKDSFGLSWQIVPEAMDRMMSSSDGEASARVAAAFLKMKKFDIAALERAWRGE